MLRRAIQKIGTIASRRKSHPGRSNVMGKSSDMVKRRNAETLKR
jgi:hypothetical protein